MSAPASRWDRWTSSTTPGRVRFSRSLLPRRSLGCDANRSARKSSSLRPCACRAVPMAPSRTRMRPASSASSLVRASACMSSRPFVPVRSVPRRNADGRADAGPAVPSSLCSGLLLDVDARAGRLELLLGRLGRFLGDALEHRLGGVVDEVLGLLEPEARERPDLLDALDLLVAGRLEDDVELRLLLLFLGDGAAAAAARHGHHRRGRGDLEGLLELLNELRQLEQGHALEVLEQVVAGELG